MRVQIFTGLLCLGPVVTGHGTYHLREMKLSNLWLLGPNEARISVVSTLCYFTCWGLR